MREQSELINDLDKIRGILIFINNSFEDLKLFQKKEYDVLIDDYAYIDRSIDWLNSSLVINFCNLLLANGDYSISKLIEKVIRLNQGNDNSRIEIYNGLLKDLVQIQKSDLLCRLKTARDKYYAHRDRNAPVKVRIDINEYIKLIDFILIAVNRISENLGIPIILLMRTPDLNGENLFWDLLQFRELKRFIVESKRDSTIIDKDELLKLLEI